MDDETDTSDPDLVRPSSYWDWMDRGAGFFGLVVSLVGGVIVGGTIGYGLGALAGTVFDADLVVLFAAVGAVLGAAEGIRVWRFARQHGAREDPWSRSP